jgi:hypothetical protein
MLDLLLPINLLFCFNPIPFYPANPVLTGTFGGLANAIPSSHRETGGKGK